MAIGQEKVLGILDRFTPADSEAWSETAAPLGEDFSDPQWEEAFGTFVTRYRPDLAAEGMVAAAEGSALPLYQDDAAQVGVGLRDVERRLRVAPLAVTNAGRVAAVARALGGSFVLSAWALGGLLGAALLAGVLIGYVARGRAQARAPLPATLRRR